MSVVIQKGNAFTGRYDATEIASQSDWTGTVGVYSSYPGTAIFEVPLTIGLGGAYLTFTLPSDSILNLNAGVYSLVGNMISVAGGIDTFRADFITVTDAVVSDQPMTTLTMTISKIDGTPAGKETRILTNTVDGAIITLGWDGVTVTASHPVADEVTGVIVGIETVSTKTNAAGYAQLAVIKGQTVTVTCPSFGKSVTVDTTGLDEIDLSSYF